MTTPRARRRPAPVVALAATLAGLLAVTGATPAPAAPKATRPAHVVLVIFGGGVRTQELLGRPELCPTIREIGRAGVVADGWTAGGADPVDATEALLTGRDVAVTTPNPTRPEFPTLLEYARKGLGGRPEDVAFASYADGEALDLATSSHADYGAPFAPALLGGDGPFGEPLRGLLRLFGRPNPTPPRTWELLDGLRATTARAAGGPHGAAEVAAAAETRRLERALLEEVDRRSRDLAGPAALDARAIRAGVTALRVFRPRLLVVRLGQADVAQKDLYAYWDVLKRDDAELARLRAEIAADPALATSTTLLVVADLGRDAALDARGGLARGDGSLDQTTVALVAEGVAVRRGATARTPRAARDLCPTIGRLLGVATPHATGVVRDDLFVVD